jgi:toxin ParE1/3/4
MGKARRSSQSELDLVDIWSYIADDDPAAADRVLDGIEDACTMLAEHPFTGVRRDDLAPGLRFYPVGNYLIFYVLSREEITIVRVIHGARDYRREFD